MPSRRQTHGPEEAEKSMERLEEVWQTEQIDVNDVGERFLEKINRNAPAYDPDIPSITIEEILALMRERGFQNKRST